MDGQAMLIYASPKEVPSLWYRFSTSIQQCIRLSWPWCVCFRCVRFFMLSCNKQCRRDMRHGSDVDQLCPGCSVRVSACWSIEAKLVVIELCTVRHWTRNILQIAITVYSTIKAAFSIKSITSYKCAYCTVMHDKSIAFLYTYEFCVRALFPNWHDTWIL